MTKNTFIKLNLENATCKICNRLLDISNFTYNKLHSDAVGECRSCQWVENHPDKIQYLKDKYKNINVVHFVRFIFESKNPVLNEIAQNENISLDDAINITRDLNIGNKRIIVKSKCKTCGNEIEYVPSAYNANKNHYCSHECYYKDKSNTSLSGEYSVYYNRIETSCTNCGKSIKVIPYRYSLKNRFGDNHNFCSKECYWEYRSKYYIAEKSAKNLIDWNSPELKAKMRKNLLKRMTCEKRLNSKPQLIVNELLSTLNINYMREYSVEYYSIDNYLQDQNLMIEVMGDYWHSNPNRYNKDKYGLNEKQLNGIHRDKLKYSYVKNHYNIEILYLWETDILSNPLLCQNLIYEYIKTNGNLPNYNSFNYELDANQNLILKSQIIIPYKDKKLSEYKTILKKAS